MRIVLLSNHWYPSPRRAGFHHLADAYEHAGHDVTFVTVGFSLLSYARGDYRTKYAGIWRARNTLQQLRPRMASYVFFTPWHPHTLLIPALNRLSTAAMDRYEKLMPPALCAVITQADLIIYESSAALFLFHAAHRLAPTAQHLYRVSDDIRILRSTHPRMIELEQEIAPFFDSISVPCAGMLRKFPALPKLAQHCHGINKAAFDTVRTSPYAAGSRNAILVSAWRSDDFFFRAVAHGCPDVHFHCIGPLAQRVKASNVHYYGELPFNETLSYIKFADVGLQVVQNMGLATQSLTDNLKIIQYRYCGLPIVAPDFLDLHREGVFYYGKTPDSCCESVNNALATGKNTNFAAEVHTWDDIAAELLHSVSTVKCSSQMSYGRIT